MFVFVQYLYTAHITDVGIGTFYPVNNQQMVYGLRGIKPGHFIFRFIPARGQSRLLLIFKRAVLGQNGFYRGNVRIGQIRDIVIILGKQYIMARKNETNRK